MSASNLPLNISYDAVSDYFNCPVCMCELNETSITPCGHRYCDSCIKECLDRHHKCPCCNKHVTTKELIRDHQFDDLIQIIGKEKDKSEKKYFDSLIDGAVQGIDAGSHNEARGHFSPVEVVLKKHLKESLIAHEKYYQDLQKEMLKRKEAVQVNLIKQKEELYSSGFSAVEISQKLELMMEEVERQNKCLEDELERMTGKVAEAYDKYLSEHIPNMTILPVKVSAVLLGKNVTLPDISLKPNDGMPELKQMIINQMATKGDKLLEFGKDVKFLAFGPFEKLNGHEMYLMVKDKLEQESNHPHIQLLAEKCRPVLDLSLRPGSVIAIYGQVKCESDIPKECFAKTFQKGQAQPMDYFNCQDCKFNWICRPCMESCHKDHAVVPYIMKHQPTWACCYCPKRKKCIINTPVAVQSSLFT